LTCLVLKTTIPKRLGIASTAKVHQIIFGGAFFRILVKCSTGPRGLLDTCATSRSRRLGHLNLHLPPWHFMHALMLCCAQLKTDCHCTDTNTV